MKIKSYLLSILIFISVFTNAQNSGTKLNNKQLKLVIDSLSAAINKNYIFPDKAKLMTDAVKAQYKKGIYNNAKDERELSDLINKDILAAHFDGHFRFYFDPEYAKMIDTPMADSLRVQQYRIDLKEMQSRSFDFIKAEVLAGNIGYLRWDGFVGMVDEAAPTFKSAFKIVENTSALIIDMRNNGGGSPDMVLHTQNYFFNKKVGMNHIFSRMDTIMRYTDPTKTEFKLNMPVYILTARRTFSGAEDFTYGLKFANRATVVGDTTGGGAHPTGGFSIGMGFVVNIPFARSYHEVTMTDWEGTGVRPDVPVNSEYALYKAQTLIYKDLKSKAEDERQKNDLQWAFDVAQNKLSLAKQILSDSVTISKDYLKNLAGEYKPKKEVSPLPMLIVFKGNNIYRRVVNNGAPDARLSPISATRFVYDDDSGRYFDFVLDKGGKVLGINVTRWDGTNYFEKIK
jgi:hypothetical protein